MSFELITKDGLNYWHVPDWADRGLIHGWGDRTIDGSADCSKFASLFGLQRLAKFKQTHSTDILSAEEDLANPEKLAKRNWLIATDWPEADGWIIDRTRLEGSRSAFFIRTADCFPVIVADFKTGMTLNLHCGWQGTVDGILLRGLELLKSQGSSIKELEIGIGPGIRPCCFEIKSEVAERVKFAGQSCGVNSISIEEKIRICGDLPAILKGQALSKGVSAELIQELPLCTVCENRFFSYRRTPDEPGRQITFVAVL